MSKGGMRYGPRFNGGSVSGTRGAGLTNFVKPPQSKWALIRRNLDPESIKKATLKGTQQTSLNSRAKKGIKPSLPHFSIEGPPPEPPPKATGPDWLEVARRAFLPHICVAHTVILQTEGQVLVAMRHEGKDFNVCLKKTTGKIMWTEGPAPYVAKNGAQRRKEC